MRLSWCGLRRELFPFGNRGSRRSDTRELRAFAEYPIQTANAADQDKRRHHGPEAREKRFAEAAAS